MREIKSLNLAVSERQRELTLLNQKIGSMNAEKQLREREILSTISALEFELSELLSKNVKIVQ